MKQNLFDVWIEDKTTQEKMHLYVWATNNDEATHSLTPTLIGYRSEYRWLGTGPVYENNEIVTREI